MNIGHHCERGILTLCFDRPEKKNALTTAMYAALSQHLAAAEADPAVRVVVLTGAGGNFTAGNDLRDFLGGAFSEPGAPVWQFINTFAGFTKPIVAAVGGLAIGIGVTILLHCDLVYLADDARLSTPFVQLGLVPEFGSSALLPRLAGHARSFEKLVLGRPITPAEAVAMGIANAVVPVERLAAQAAEAAAALAALPAGAVRESRRLLRVGRGVPIVEVMRRETEVFAARLATAEAREAINALLEKRAPDFSRLG
ncbi:MAG: enoyl-CoA hydratase [Gammaproteobacteria bacterium]|nr:MAG: enoyl-CoA hydratase [Gammaproteobacteria bacterium]